MRLKWLRHGVEDYEYVEILKQLGIPSLALQIAQSVGPDWANWTRNAASIEAARTQLGTTINQMVGSGAPFNPGPSSSSTPSPANSAVGVSASELLSWWGAADATSYDVYLGTSTTPPFKATVTAASYNPGALIGGTTYYWRIVAKNSRGSTSSSIWSFTTVPGTAPSAPGPPSPASGATGVATTPALSWGASTNATSYDVYFGTSSSPAFAKNVTATSYQPGTLTTGTTYYW